jgi:fructokinase
MSDQSRLLFGGIEGGGTKFVCAVGTETGKILVETRFRTTTPDETLARSVDFFKEQAQILGPLASIGVASFGPLDPGPVSSPRGASITFGHILLTPKPGWANADIVGPLRAAFDLPIAFDTDVNGAALGEWRWGAAQGLDTFIYLTIGTGIGGGALVNGKLIHGLLHPEMGHIPLPHDKALDPFESNCPFHSDCFEGLASGPAMEKRWGQKAETLPPDHPAWELEADYIALALRSFICTLSPQRIVIGGGVAQQPQLMPLIRQKTQATLNKYVQSPAILENIDTYIVPPALGGRAGVLGAIALAQQIL